VASGTTRVLVLAGAALALAACAGEIHALNPRDWRMAEVPPSSDRGVSVLPSDWLQDVPFATVTVDGEGPFRFLVDSGCQVMLVTPELVEAAGLEVGTLPDAGLSLTDQIGPEVLVREWAAVGEFRWGTYAATGVAAAVVDLSEFRRAMGVPIDGVLPASGFRDRLLVLDYPSRTIGTSHSELTASEGGCVLEFTSTDAPTVRLDLAGRPVEALVDTGNNSALSLPESVCASLAFLTPPEEDGRTLSLSGVRVRRAGRLAGSVRLERFVFETPVVRLHPASHALVGGRALREFRVTFDFGSGRMALDRPPGIGDVVTLVE